MADDSASTSESIHESLFIFLGKLVLLQLIIACLSIIAALALAIFLLNGASVDTLLSADVIVGIILQLLDAALAVFVVLQWLHTSYTITPEEIIIRSGVFKVATRIYKTAGIEGVEIRKTTFGKLWNYGTITFLNGGVPPKIELPDIPRPEYYAGIIEQGLRSGRESAIRKE